MPKAMIVYASLTGNTEMVAFSLAKKLEALDVEVEVVEALNIEAEELEDQDICIVATYTYGTDGEIPDEIIDFHDDLKDIDLSGKIYGIVGSGQDFYEHFCRAVDYFEKQLRTTNGVKGAESLKFELNAQKVEDQKRLKNFAREIVDTYNSL